MLVRFTRGEVAKTLRLAVAWSVRFLIVGGLGGGTLEARYSRHAVEITSEKIRSANELAQAMLDVVPGDRKFAETFAVASETRSYLITVLHVSIREPASVGE